MIPKYLSLHSLETVLKSNLAIHKTPKIQQPETGFQETDKRVYARALKNHRKYA